MPKVKGEPKEKAEKAEKEAKAAFSRTCPYCLAEGKAEEESTFTNMGVWGNHVQVHKAESQVRAKESKDTVMEDHDIKGAKEQRAKDLALVQQVTTEPLDEMDTLREILANAGVLARRESIISSFATKDPDDIPKLDNILVQAGVPFAARRMALMNWSDHRGVDTNYTDTKYPQGGTAKVEAEEKIATQAKSKDPMDIMTETIEKQMKLMTMQMNLQYLQRMMRTGADSPPDGLRVVDGPKEEPKLRIMEDGQSVRMTESEWAEYLIGRQRWREQLTLQQSKEEKKKEAEKIPFRLDDGTIVQVPSDQVDKWLFMMKSTSPDNKKDVFELMREQEKSRQDMERFYQQQMQAVKDQNYQMIAERQEQAIRQLQANLQNRPNPIQEMVNTQEELKSAGLLASQEGKGIDQHRLEMQEKKLDTTMQLVVQQQQSLNRKSDQLIAALGPIVQNYAAKAADNLPQPQDIRQQVHERRTNIAKEVLPVDESALAQIQERLEEPREEPRRRKAMVAGVHDEPNE